MDIEKNSSTPQASEQMRTLKIKTLSDTVYEIQVPSTMLVKDLKVKVEQVTNVPVDRQRLICMGQQLQDLIPIGVYAKDEITWIYLVAKVPSPDQPAAAATTTTTATATSASTTSTSAQNATQSTTATSQQPQPNRNQFDAQGGNIHISQGNIGDIQSLIGNISNMMNLGRPLGNLNPASVPAQGVPPVGQSINIIHHNITHQPHQQPPNQQNAQRPTQQQQQQQQQQHNHHQAPAHGHPSHPHQHANRSHPNPPHQHHHQHPNGQQQPTATNNRVQANNNNNNNNNQGSVHSHGIRSNLVSNPGPIVINRPITMPHQELLNLGGICNNLMGAGSTFPGPPLPVVPQHRNSAQLIGSYLSNWQFQVQRTLPFVHRLGELLQREPYMTHAEDRQQTNALSLEVGSALNELVACTTPVVSLLRDLQLGWAPGQVNFDPIGNARSTQQQRPPQQYNLASQNNSLPTGRPNTNANNNNQQQQPSSQQQPVPPPTNPLLNPFAQMMSQLGNSNTNMQIRVEQNQNDGQNGNTNNNPAQNGSIFISSISTSGPQVGQSTTNSHAETDADNLDDQQVNIDVSTIINIGESEDLSQILSQVLSGLGGQAPTGGQANPAAGIFSAINRAMNPNQNNNSGNPSQNNRPPTAASSQPSTAPPAQQATASQRPTIPVPVANTATTSTTNSTGLQTTSTATSASSTQPVTATSSAQQGPSVVTQPPMNPFAMMMGGMGGGNIMNMTVRQLSQLEPELEQGSFEAIDNIIGDVLVGDLIQNIMSGQFLILDQLQEKIRIEIELNGLDRDSFTRTIAEIIAKYLVVPQVHQNLVFDGIDSQGIGQDILEERLPGLYDLIYQDYPASGTLKFSEEFTQAVKQLIGELFSNMAECLHNGLVDLEIIFKHSFKEIISRQFGEQTGVMVGMLVSPMVWEKVKQLVLIYKEEEQTEVD